MKKIILILSILLSIQIMAQNEKETIVVIHTPHGDITAKLYNETPQHRDNFIKLVNEGWYEGSPFHRVINKFMIQGGQNADGRQDPGYTVEAEFRPELYHKKGVLAAARQPDQINPKKASSGCQFYIVQGELVNDAYLNRVTAQTGHKFSEEQIKVYKTIGGTPHLDGAYTVFGEVLTGFDVIDKIAAVEVSQPGYVPVKPVNMTIEILD